MVVWFSSSLCKRLPESRGYILCTYHPGPSLQLLQNFQGLLPVLCDLPSPMAKDSQGCSKQDHKYKGDICLQIFHPKSGYHLPKWIWSGFPALMQLFRLTTVGCKLWRPHLLPEDDDHGTITFRHQLSWRWGQYSFSTSALRFCIILCTVNFTIIHAYTLQAFWHLSSLLQTSPRIL